MLAAVAVRRQRRKRVGVVGGSGKSSAELPLSRRASIYTTTLSHHEDEEQQQIEANQDHVAVAIEDEEIARNRVRLRRRQRAEKVRKKCHIYLLSKEKPRKSNLHLFISSHFTKLSRTDKPTLKRKEIVDHLFLLLSSLSANKTHLFMYERLLYQQQQCDEWKREEKRKKLLIREQADDSVKFALSKKEKADPIVRLRSKGIS